MKMCSRLIWFSPSWLQKLSLLRLFSLYFISTSSVAAATRPSSGLDITFFTANYLPENQKAADRSEGRITSCRVWSFQTKAAILTSLDLRWLTICLFSCTSRADFKLLKLVRLSDPLSRVSPGRTLFRAVSLTSRWYSFTDSKPTASPRLDKSLALHLQPELLMFSYGLSRLRVREFITLVLFSRRLGSSSSVGLKGCCQKVEVLMSVIFSKNSELRVKMKCFCIFSQQASTKMQRLAERVRILTSLTRYPRKCSSLRRGLTKLIRRVLLTRLPCFSRTSSPDLRLPWWAVGESPSFPFHRRVSCGFRSRYPSYSRYLNPSRLCTALFLSSLYPFSVLTASMKWLVRWRTSLSFLVGYSRVPSCLILRSERTRSRLVLYLWRCLNSLSWQRDSSSGPWLASLMLLLLWATRLSFLVLSSAVMALWTLELPCFRPRFLRDCNSLLSLHLLLFHTLHTRISSHSFRAQCSKCSLQTESLLKGSSSSFWMQLSTLPLCTFSGSSSWKDIVRSKFISRLLMLTATGIRWWQLISFLLTPSKQHPAAGMNRDLWMKQVLTLRTNPISTISSATSALSQLAATLPCWPEGASVRLSWSCRPSRSDPLRCRERKYWHRYQQVSMESSLSSGGTVQVRHQPVYG